MGVCAAHCVAQLVVHQQGDRAVAVVVGSQAIRNAHHRISAHRVAHAEEGGGGPAWGRWDEIRRRARGRAGHGSEGVALGDGHRRGRRRGHRSRGTGGQAGREGPAGAEADAVDHRNADRLGRLIGGKGHRDIALRHVVRACEARAVGGIQRDRYSSVGHNRAVDGQHHRTGGFAHTVSRGGKGERRHENRARVDGVAVAVLRELLNAGVLCHRCVGLCVGCASSRMEGLQVILEGLLFTEHICWQVGSSGEVQT